MALSNLVHLCENFIFMFIWSLNLRADSCRYHVVVFMGADLVDVTHVHDVAAV